MERLAELGWAGVTASDHRLVIRIRIVSVSRLIMRHLACVGASLLLCLSASLVRAQQDLVNCEAFSSGFTTPEGCIDGSQPSSGPIPTNEDVVENDWGDMPFGWYGPGAWMDY